jgi:acyl-coenzyme A thioesterase PaaI-like protein
MDSQENTPPPIPGDWVKGIVTRTGPWTVGDLWVDWNAKRYCLKVTDAHCNAVGGMHGGAMATFLDGQVFVYQDPQAADSHTPTISLHVDYLAPPVAGDWLVAEVVLVKTTRTMLFSQAIASVGDRAMARSHAIYKNNAGKDFR